MTRETFEKLLDDKNILWNDLVKIEVYNPNYRKTFFKKIPKTITFLGALAYHTGDNNVEIAMIDLETANTKWIYFDFEQIVDIERKMR